MSSRFGGKVAVGAGGTGGLGKWVSMAFLDEGAKVVVSHWVEEEFAELQAMATPRGTAGEGQHGGVPEEIAVRKWIEGVLTAHGRVDVLVNAIGGYVGGVKLWEMESQV